MLNKIIIQSENIRGFWLLMLFALMTTAAIVTEAVVYNHPYDGPALAPVPYQVSFQYTDTYGINVHFCSGSIISEFYALSAAHCFFTVDLNRVRIAVGSNRLNLTRGALQARHSITKLHVHKLFQPLHGYDVALARVSPKFPLDRVHVARISYVAKQLTAPNMLGYLASWGRIPPGGVHDLQLISFRTVSTQDCWKRGFSYTSNKDLCAYSYKENGRGACDGDSGGGLVSPKFNQLLGVLSYGRRPCEPRRIYVYTSMWAIQDWIRNTIRN